MKHRGIIITASVLAGILIIAVAGIYKFNIAQNDLITTSDSLPTSIKDTTYVIEHKAVTLKGGTAEESVAESSAQITTKYFGNEVEGDFNNDGRADTAFLLTQETGGSGTFYYLVAALKTSGGYQGTNAVLLGDRIAPQTTGYLNGLIVVNYAERKPAEPMTAIPTVGVSRYFRVEGSVLVEVQP